MLSPPRSSSEKRQAQLRGCWDWTGPDSSEDSVRTCPTIVHGAAAAAEPGKGPVLSCDLNPTPHRAAGGPWASVPHV